MLNTCPTNKQMPNICLSNKWLYAPNKCGLVSLWSSRPVGDDIFLQSILRGSQKSLCCLTLMRQATASVLISRIRMRCLTLRHQATGSMLLESSQNICVNVIIYCQWKLIFMHVQANFGKMCVILEVIVIYSSQIYLRYIRHNIKYLSYLRYIRHNI